MEIRHYWEMVFCWCPYLNLKDFLNRYKEYKESNETVITLIPLEYIHETWYKYKLGTNINQHQTMCREQEMTLHLHYLQNYGLLKLNHHQTMFREKEL